jgi:hypothetical protein
MVLSLVIDAERISCDTLISPRRTIHKVNSFNRTPSWRGAVCAGWRGVKSPRFSWSTVIGEKGFMFVLLGAYLEYSSSKTILSPLTPYLCFQYRPII